MPGKCKFRDTWLIDDVWRVWLKQGKDEYTGFCALCKKMIDVSHSGVNDLKMHAKGKKHKELETNLRDGKQLTLHAFRPAQSLNPPTKAQSVTSVAACSSSNSSDRVQTQVEVVQSIVDVNNQSPRPISSFFFT